MVIIFYLLFVCLYLNLVESAANVNHCRGSSWQRWQEAACGVPEACRRFRQVLSACRKCGNACAWHAQCSFAFEGQCSLFENDDDDLYCRFFWIKIKLPALREGQANIMYAECTQNACIKVGNRFTRV